jgi:homoserine kinase
MQNEQDAVSSSASNRDCAAQDDAPVTISRTEAYAPATVANLGVGFDILGLALREPGDTIVVEPRDEPGAVIHLIEGDRGKLSYEPEKNTACIAANSVLKTIGAPHGVTMTLMKGLPLASGLGSSAASAVAAAVAVNALFGEPLTRAELLPAALEGEASVSGYHADNVAPCLFGGLTLVTGLRANQIYRLPIPEHLHLALVTPDVAVPTIEARAVLPQAITLRTLVAQTASVARLIDALHRADIAAMAAAMEADEVIEPARAHLMPMLAEVRRAAHRVGAPGMVISGAGPTLIAFCDNYDTAVQVAGAMKAVYDDAGIACTARCTQVSPDGAYARATL